MSPPLSEWTDEQVSRVIAEHLEPKPIPYTYNDSQNFPGKISKLGAWIFNGYWGSHYRSCATHTGLRCDCFGDGPQDEKCQPRNFVKDPTMVLMLLEKRFFYSVRKHARGWVFQDEQGKNHKYIRQLTVLPFGRALAEHYIQAHGLEGKA